MVSWIMAGLIVIGAVVGAVLWIRSEKRRQPPPATTPEQQQAEDELMSTRNLPLGF
jgi:hypothetical protein